MAKHPHENNGDVTAPRRVIASLEDLSLRSLHAEVALVDGEVVEVPLRLPSFLDMARLDMEIADPVPSIMGVDKDGRPIFDDKNPAYLNALQTARIKRLYNKLIASLAFPVPGETLDDKIAAVDAALGYDVVNQLIGYLSELGIRQKDRLKARSFRPDGIGTGGLAHSEGDGVSEQGGLLEPSR